MYRSLTLAATLLATTLTQPVAAQTAPKDASQATRAANRAQLAQLPMADKQSFDDARRGLVESLGSDQVIMSAQGRPAWSLKGYEFLSKEQAPDTVNPALWRHARVNMGAGLFKVTDGIYQLRGFDLSNMTVIEGKTGPDPGRPADHHRNREGGAGAVLQAPSAQAGGGSDLFAQPRRPFRRRARRGERGGRGVRQGQDHRARRLHGRGRGRERHRRQRHVAPGHLSVRPVAAARRKGQVDAGLGKSISFGTVSLIPPTMLIEKTVETHSIDGVDIVFELTPGRRSAVRDDHVLPAVRRC